MQKGKLRRSRTVYAAEAHELTISPFLPTFKTSIFSLIVTNDILAIITVLGLIDVVQQ